MEAWFDGGSRGNPGVAGAGWVLKRNGTFLQAGYVFVGDHATNNQAEYAGMIAALNAAVAYNAEHITIYGDSLLVIKQMKGEWQVKDAKMRHLHAQAHRIVQQIQHVVFVHVLRHLNTEADLLSNMAMDSRSSAMGPELLKTTPTPTKPTAPTYDGPTCAVRIRRQNGRIVQDCDVWVGAAWTKGGWQLPRSEWCNTFAHMHSREAALRAYQTHVRTHLAERIPLELKGRRLGCFCEPTDPTCHAVWLASVAEDPALLLKN